MAKRVTVIILTVICCFTFWLNVYSANIVIDGIAKERDWVDSFGEVAVSSKDISNCAVEFASVASVADYSNNIIYFCFNVIVDGIVDETTPHGVSVSVNSAEPVRITRDSVSEYDTVLYNYTAAVYEHSSTDFSVEAALGIKHGIDTVYEIEVQFIDGNGDYSNAYSVTLPEPPTQETTTAYYPENTTLHADSYTESNVDEKSTTIKETTKKYTTTKKETTVRTTVPKTEKLTFEPDNITEKQSKTTKLHDETTVKIVTVYVPVTDKLPTESFTENVQAEATASSDNAENANSVSDNSTFKIRKEIAYVGIAVLFIVTFGMCVIINMNYDKNNGNGSK
ncbi:MAG: hypothetical protein IKK85_02870 [Clostridia bacterium]|nr:hypothetical protein [Clostridia bacterium]